MESQNAIIKNVTMGLDERNNLVVSVEFAAHHFSNIYKFDLMEQMEVQRLAKLLEYAEVKNVEDLKGRMVRVMAFYKLFHGFGHPIEDKFVATFGDTFMESTEEQFKKMITEK